MADLRKLKRRAAQIGAAVETDIVGRTHECRVVAPSGFHFADTDLHEHVDCSYRPWKPDYTDLLDRMSLGLEPCTPETCQLWDDEIGACEFAN